MAIAQAEPDIPERDLGRSVRPWLRVLVLVYGCASFVGVLVRLQAERFTRAAWGHALTLLYIEALSFLAVFGGVSLLAGLIGGHRREAKRRRREKAKDPLDSNPLAGVERTRGR